MPYAVGDLVVFADHGATVVHELRTRVLAGTRREYVVLRYPFHQECPDLVATVPIEGGLVAPLSDVAGPACVRQALALLAIPGPHVESGYAERRHRAYLIKLGGLDEEEGDDPILDIREVAEVVRNLTHRDRLLGLEMAERPLLEFARTVFISELALAEGIDLDRAAAILDLGLSAHPPSND